MKKTFFTLLFAVVACAAFAQEQSYSSQYQLYPILVNPGYTGFQGKHELLANARSSWAGFAGAPTTVQVMYNGPIGDKLALGGGFFSDRQGNQSTLRLQMNYAFRIRFNKVQMGLGLSTEFLRQQASINLLDNNLVQKGDDVVEGAVEGINIFDASVGMHMLYDNKLFVNFALPNTIRTRLDDAPVTEPTESRSLFQHYMFQLGYIVHLPAQNIKVVPSLAMRNFRDTPYQIDLNVQGRFLDDKLIAGLTFRPNNRGAMAFQLGSRYNQFQVVYSYDLSFSKFQQYNIGSHEITVSCLLQKKTAASASEPSDLYN
jgi:type IX secretion system PorP/SprF family membrane protein